MVNGHRRVSRLADPDDTLSVNVKDASDTATDDGDDAHHHDADYGAP